MQQRAERRDSNHDTHVAATMQHLRQFLGLSAKQHDSSTSASATCGPTGSYTPSWTTAEQHVLQAIQHAAPTSHSRPSTLPQTLLQVCLHPQRFRAHVWEVLLRRLYAPQSQCLDILDAAFAVDNRFMLGRLLSSRHRATLLAPDTAARMLDLAIFHERVWAVRQLLRDPGIQQQELVLQSGFRSAMASHHISLIRLFFRCTPWRPDSELLLSCLCLHRTCLQEYLPLMPLFSKALQPPAAAPGFAASLVEAALHLHEHWRLCDIVYCRDAAGIAAFPHVRRLALTHGLQTISAYCKTLQQHAKTPPRRRILRRQRQDPQQPQQQQQPSQQPLQGSSQVFEEHGAKRQRV